MTFKKDYINYVLHTVVNNTTENFYNDERLRKIVDKINSVDDVVAMTYMVGKTAGLEFLFKYLLYISDKIDKSQITIFNLKDNYDYDIKNLTKICQAIQTYKSSKKIDYIPESEADTIKEKAKDETGTPIRIKISGEDTKEKSLKERISEDNKLKDKKSEEKDKSKDKSKDKPSNLMNIEDAGETSSESGESKLTLIENPESYTGEAEVFELSDIDNAQDDDQGEDENENVVAEDDKEVSDEETGDEVFELDGLEEDMQDKAGTADTEEKESDDIVTDEEMEKSRQEMAIKEASLKRDSEEQPEEKEEAQLENTAEDITEENDEIEILVNKPVIEDEFSETESPVKEESVTNEAYYKFETKFFEEVKILEKLFSGVGNECAGEEGKLSEKCLQSLSVIIEITSELSNLSRQLSFDLISDIFLTMNLYFTKTISAPYMLTGERINLLDSALALVNSLIKGEDYLNYDTIVEKIEKLKNEVSKPSEEHDEIKEEIISEMSDESEDEEPPVKEPSEEIYSGITEEEYPDNEKTKNANAESSNFKMKYLIKEFEKSFQSIGELKGEYSRFDALEKIDDLNNALRLIAKISASVKMRDVLKLAEVAYVFLKYVKDYRMDLLDPEIQQIVKYIIFTFKMLLTNRKPEDFNVLVQHLNNPVKIFTDS